VDSVTVAIPVLHFYLRAFCRSFNPVPCRGLFSLGVLR
jgi:hypothetical protein